MIDHEDCAACGASLDEPASAGELPLPRDLREVGDPPAPTWQLELAGCPRCGSAAILGGPPSPTVLAAMDRPTTRTETSRTRVLREAHQVLANLPVAQGDTVVAIGAGDGLLLRPFQQSGCRVVNVEPADSRRVECEAAGMMGISRPLGDGARRELASADVRANLVLARTSLSRSSDPDAMFAELTDALAEDGRIVVTLPDVETALGLSPVGLVNPEWCWLWTPHALSLMALRHGLAIEHVDRASQADAWTCTLAWATEDSPFPLARPATGVLEHVAAYARRTRNWRQTLGEHVDRMHAEGRWIAAVGASATGVTALNLAGVDGHRLDAIVDLNPFKRGRIAPGVGVAILGMGSLRAAERTELLSLVPKLESELRRQHADLVDHGTVIHTIGTPA